MSKQDPQTEVAAKGEDKDGAADNSVSQTSQLLPFLNADESRVRKEALATVLGLSATEDGRIELVATNAPQVRKKTSSCPSQC